MRLTVQQLKIIDTKDGLQELINYLADKEYVAYDVETTGLTKRDEIVGLSVCAEETIAYYVILAKWNPISKALDYLETHHNIRLLLDLLKTKHLICHNGVFDCYMTEANFKVSLIGSLHTDTMILAHLLNENRRVGLKDLGVSIFGHTSDAEAIEMKASVIANGGSITKDKYEIYKADSQLLAKYGAKDALLTYKLFMYLIVDLYDQGLDKFFYEEESMPLLRGPTYDLNTTGLQVDVQALTILKNTLIAECEEAKSFIYTEIAPYIKDKYPGTHKKNIFNIGSSQQLSWLLFGQLKLEFNTLTKAGKKVCKDLGMKLPYTRAQKAAFIGTCVQAIGQVYEPEALVNGKKRKAKVVVDPWKYIACDKAALQKLSPKYEWINSLLQYQRKMKLLSTYIEGLEERIQYGVIHPSYLQHGTTSGRYSSRNPNFQNLPRDDQRIKKCITARTGKVFVSADYSQLEPRVFAYYSQDKRLMSAFDGSTDFYSVIGIELYDKFDAVPLKDGQPDAFGIKYPKLRQIAKTLALARAYGATPFQLAPTIGKSIEDTAEDIIKYDESFPGVRSMMLEAHNMAKKNGYVTNLFGRPRRIPEAIDIEKLYGTAEHHDLPYEARSLLNLACNHRIQSTGASIINRAAIKFYNDCKDLRINCKIISQIHDELIIECAEKDADNVNTILRNAMENTTILPGVPLEAIPRITKTLAK